VLWSEDPTFMIPARIRRLGFLILALFGVQAVSWMLGFVHKRVSTWLGARITADMRNELYRRTLRLRVRFHDKREVGALMNRISNDAGTLNDFLIGGIPSLVLNGLTFGGVLTFVVIMSPFLTAVVLAPIPLIWGFSYYIRRRMMPFHIRAWLAESKYWSKITELFFGIRVVKAFAQETREVNDFVARSAKVHGIHVETNRRHGPLSMLMGLLTSSGSLLVWGVGGREVVQGRMSVGTLLAFQAYIGTLYGPLLWFGEFPGWLQKALIGAQRIFEVLDAPAEAYSDKVAIPMPRIEGRIVFKGVTFGYDPSRPVLQEFNLDVKPGETIGVVGRSGAGKTTMMNLLCRFYDPDAGRIEIDGFDARRIRLEDLRRQIAVVPQDSFLFAGSVAKNIRYGKRSATFPELLRAAKIGNAHQFATKMHDGYDTDVGERGCHLSGGEKQRLAIARAVLRDPRILVLDEATSSLDVETERQIQEATRALRRGRTTFIVAHRLSTVRDADRIIVVDKGRIIEVGSHKELMKKKGVFYEMVMAQKAVSAAVPGGAPPSLPPPSDVPPSSETKTPETTTPEAPSGAAE